VFSAADFQNRFLAQIASMTHLSGWAQLNGCNPVLIKPQWAGLIGRLHRWSTSNAFDSSFI
jgi:hypothetical protein